MENVYTKDYVIAPKTRQCGCSFTMKLEAKEDSHRNIWYVYECEYRNCLKKIEVWRSN